MFVCHSMCFSIKRIFVTFVLCSVIRSNTNRLVCKMLLLYNRFSVYFLIICTHYKMGFSFQKVPFFPGEGCNHNPIITFVSIKFQIPFSVFPVPLIFSLFSYYIFHPLFNRASFIFFLLII